MYSPTLEEFNSLLFPVVSGVVVTISIGTTLVVDLTKHLKKNVYFNIKVNVVPLNFDPLHLF